MAHIAADRVKETTTTTGTGDITLAGAAAGFQAFSAVMVNTDTTFYSIVHQTLAEWEVGLGTWNTGGTLTRTTVLESSNAGAAVNFSAGTKDVFITIPAISQRWGAMTVTPSINQNNYNPAGLEYINRLRINPSVSLRISGLAGGVDGREITISNSSTDYLIILEHQGTASDAANRFDLPNGFPYFLMPGDRITFGYSAVSSRWQAISASSNMSQMGLTEFTDFVGGTTGTFTLTVNGTGASAQISGYLINTTERPCGVVQIDSGTTATGRATLGTPTTGGTTGVIVPTLGPALSVVRLAAEALPTGTETFQLFSGFADTANGTVTDVVAWNLRWNGSAAEWSQDRISNGTATRTAVNSPTPDTNYIWLIVFLNADWTRADFLYSEDSVNFLWAGSQTTGLPGSARTTGWVAASIIKSLGTGQRNVSIDLAGNRIDHARG